VGEFEDALRARAGARVGQVLRGKWQLDRLIGIGGMAAVYAATHRNGKRGAVKMLHLELSSNDALRSRFLREGYAANRVGHPGAVSVLDDDVADDGSVFLVMELLEGATVEARAEAQPERRLPLAEVLAIADGLLDTLGAAHEKGIVHRDLKPENLFVTQQGEVKVLDFGIARIQGASASAGSTTRTGETMGTPAFMPPEQALGNWDQVDGRTDLWAVGATMFTLLTGHYVHAADSVQKLMLAAMTKAPAPIATVVPGLPSSVCAIIDRALAFEPSARWQTARAMQEAVRGARHELARAPHLPGLATSVVPSASARAPVSSPTAMAATASPVSRNTAARAARRAGRGGVALAAIATVATLGSVGWIVAGWLRGAPTTDLDGDAAASTVAPAAPSSSMGDGAQTAEIIAPAAASSAAAVASAAPSASAAASTTAAPRHPRVRAPAGSASAREPKAPPASTSAAPEAPVFDGRF
jgi:serine/threonine-protein kinase